MGLDLSLGHHDKLAAEVNGQKENVLKQIFIGIKYFLVQYKIKIKNKFKLKFKPRYSCYSTRLNISQVSKYILLFVGIYFPVF
ncbi:hypothetical protein GDO86_013319 [Hymenochirus boettgeri]|uniref:Uncharacterized protein n=1 Tax=Hymenochirus boettgeri TaxID=247094 RepID=A0A8T2IW71_9PIPI|nr:hypothetical protein GDO86_013319 [Hymenochirus boettgeri]